MEAKKLVEDVEIETHNVDIVERVVADVLEFQIQRAHGIKNFRDEEQPFRNSRSCIRFLQRLLVSTVCNLPHGNNVAWVENGIKMSLWLTMEHGMDLKVQWKFVQ
ncbi:hypothetical protein CK203_103219 [Vitis vinifera]|uniref:Uncharacterized protein n=1 Tax=Vitis vinifera TaxID=29760 RepID=A0A438FHC1_VITVI|nr:hypothetical protein CK203_103219 [Vitis vinifera]